MKLLAEDHQGDESYLETCMKFYAALLRKTPSQFESYPMYAVTDIVSDKTSGQALLFYSRLSTNNQITRITHIRIQEV